MNPELASQRLLQSEMFKSNASKFDLHPHSQAMLLAVVKSDQEHSEDVCDEIIAISPPSKARNRIALPPIPNSGGSPENKNKSLVDQVSKCGAERFGV